MLPLFQPFLIIEVRFIPCNILFDIGKLIHKFIWIDKQELFHLSMEILPLQNRMFIQKKAFIIKRGELLPALAVSYGQLHKFRYHLGSRVIIQLLFQVHQPSKSINPIGIYQLCFLAENICEIIPFNFWKLLLFGKPFFLLGENSIWVWNLMLGAGSCT